MKNIFIKSFKTVLTVLPVSTTVLLSLYVKSGLGSVDWETIMRGTPGGK